MFVASLINLGLSVWLVPKYGLLGAAIATSVCTLGMAVAFMCQIRHFLGFWPFKAEMRGVLFSGAIAMLILYLFKIISPTVDLFILLCSGFAFFCVYYAALLVTCALDDNDFAIINSLKKKYIKLGIHTEALWRTADKLEAESKKQKTEKETMTTKERAKETQDVTKAKAGG